MPLATGVDGAVRRIQLTYEVRGMIEKVTSYDNATVGSGSIVNEVQRAYNAFAQLTTEYQSHTGAVVTATSPKVQYAFANGSANHVRPTTMIYPSGRNLLPIPLPLRNPPTLPPGFPARVPNLPGSRPGWVPLPGKGDRLPVPVRIR
jgi:hypothetical protein